MSEKRPVVLLVEDNPADADLVEEAFSEAHIDCLLDILRDGAQAIDFIERLDSGLSEACPDLFLLDLNLPKVGGEAVLKRVRSSPVCKSVKVLIVSSSDAPSDRKRAMDLGASDYFRKPSSLEQFMEFGSKVRVLLQGTNLAKS
jgi:DNA-binding response OmpR family regulator